MQSHINNKENNEDTLDNSSIKYDKADEASNTKDINEYAPGNEDQKSTKESTNE